LIHSALFWLKCCRCLPKFQRPIEALNFVESLIGDTEKLKELHDIETTEECYEIATVVIRTDLRFVNPQNLEFVETGFRQKGIGTEFVRTALERAKERGRKHVTAFATVEPLRKTYANVQ
jgi:GNAT superfamily N-acetyltransferase